jgi:hypothetical protein
MEKTLGPEHPRLSGILLMQVDVLRRQDRKREAKALRRRVREIENTQAARNARHTVDIAELQK